VDLTGSRRRGGRRTGGDHAWVPLTVVVVGASIAVGVLVARGNFTAYAVLAAFALGVAVWIFTDHLFGVLVVWVAVEGIAYPFVRYPWYHNLYTFDRFMIVAMGAALVFVTWPKMTKTSARLAIAFVVFAVVYGLRAFFTNPLPAPPKYGGINFADVSPYQPQADWLDTVAFPCIVFLVAACTITRERWEKLAAALTFLGASVAAMGILEWIFGFKLAPLAHAIPFVDTQAGVVRVSGPYSDITAYGGVLVTCLAASLYWTQLRKAYVLGGAAVLIEIVGLAPSFTKTIWGAAFAVLVISLGLRRRFSIRTVLVTVYTTGAVLFVYALLSTDPVVKERVSTSTNANFIARVGDYIQGIYIFQHWPVFGAGIDQFIAAQQFVPFVSISDIAATPSAHNSFLSVLAETGLVGFLPFAFLVFAMAALVRAWRRRARTNEEVLFAIMLLAATVGNLLMSLTLVEIYYSPSGTFLALVLGAAAARLNTMTASRPAARSMNGSRLHAPRAGPRAPRPAPVLSKR